MKTLNSLQKYIEGRKVVVARELSKIYEQIVSGTAIEVEKYFLDNKDKIRGEFVVLVSEK
jgi:16S rRNA (cytidine1402-2'-O)-methyltransferase